ncbi:hypothetical protein M9458_013621, partial [Cirrhinus mrigala]
GWNDNALKAIFYNSLNAELQTELACHREDSSFSELVPIAIRIDNLMRQTPKRKINKFSPRNSSVTASSATHSDNEPMQLNVSRITEEERAKRRENHLCFYCGETGHRSLGCPHKTKTYSRVNIQHFSLLSNKALTLPVSLKTDTPSLELTAMIDSGAALNLIISKYNIPTQPCIPPIQIKAINDTLIDQGITHQTRTIKLKWVCYIKSPSRCTLLIHPSMKLYWDFPGSPSTTQPFPGIE